jgi:hypothetical protein
MTLEAQVAALTGATTALLQEVQTKKADLLASASSAAISASNAAADRVQTGLDRAATGSDRAATVADRAATSLDKVATNADRVQTGSDRIAASNAATLASHYANDSADTDVPGGAAGERGAKFYAIKAQSDGAAQVVLAAAQAASATYYAGLAAASSSNLVAASLRFDPENGESITSGRNGMLYLPNSNNIFKDGATLYAKPIFATSDSGAICIIGSIDEAYRALNRSPKCLSTSTLSGSRRMFIELRPYQTGGSIVNQYRFHILMVGETAGGTWEGYSDPLPADFSGLFTLGIRPLGDTLQVDFWDNQKLLKTTGTLIVTRPAAWAGLGRLSDEICLGGSDWSTFPKNYASALHTMTFQRREMAHFFIADGPVTDAQFLAIASGADIPTTIGAANLRLYAPLVSGGQLTGAVTSNNPAVTNGFTLLGKLYPGSSLRRQGTSTYLTVDRLPSQAKLIRERNATVAACLHRFKFGGTAGAAQCQIADETGRIVKPWHTIGYSSDAVGGVLDAWVEYPKSNVALRAAFRFTGNPSVVAYINTDIWVGQRVIVFGQSEVNYSNGDVSGTPTGNNTALNLRLEGDAGRKVFFGKYVNNTLNAATVQSEFTPGLLGDEGVRIANYLRQVTDEPIFVDVQAISGTSMIDLMDDSDTGRQWSDAMSIANLAANRGRNGEHIASAIIIGGWEAYFGVDTAASDVLPAFCFGQATAAVPVSKINHHLWDGTFSKSAEIIIMPPNRAFVTATQASDRSNEANDRDNFRAFAVANGLRIGPETTLHRMDGNGGTHPKNGAIDGGPEMATAYAEAYAMGAGHGSYTGPVKFATAAWVAGSGQTKIRIGLPRPMVGRRGFLTTKVPGAAITGFEFKLSNAGAWSKNWLASAVFVEADVVEVTLTGPGTFGETQIAYHPGAPGNYNANITTDDAGTDGLWRAGGLLYAGWPVAGSNTPIATI